jgi:hypothetical protein
MFFYAQLFFSFKDIVMRKLENLLVICVVFLGIQINDRDLLRIGKIDNFYQKKQIFLEKKIRCTAICPTDPNDAVVMTTDS